MKYVQIYNHALAILGENQDSVGNGDYLVRAPILLAGIIAGYSQISETLLAGSGIIPSLPVTLTDEFPLDKRLAIPTAMTLASQFILDESAELSELLRVRAEKLIGDFAADVGCIREVYQ